MNNKLIAVIFLIFLLPACFTKNIQKDKQISKTEKSKNLTNESLTNESLITEEEIGSFVLEENENPFSAQFFGDTDEELTLENTEPTPVGDKQNDSVQYGFRPIYFDFDDKKIRNDQKEKLNENIDIAKNLANKGYNLSIEGHADDFAGSPQYNLVLSEDRAKTVREYFELQNIPSDKISVVGRGTEMKIVPFGNKEQQEPNRRVVIYAYSNKMKN